MERVVCPECNSRDTRCHVDGGFTCRRCGYRVTEPKHRIDVNLSICLSCGSRWIVRRADGFYRCRKCGVLMGEQLHDCVR